MREVARTVAYDGHGFLAERGEDQFAFLTGCHGFEGLGIDDFGVEHILPDVGAVLVFAFASHAGTAHLRQTIDVDGLDAHLLFYLAADAPGPGFSAEETNAELQVFLLDTHLLHYLTEVQGVGRSTAESRGTEVLHEHDLFLRIAGRGRQLHGPKLACCIVGTESAGEETVAVGHLYHVTGAYVAHGEDAGSTLCPAVNVVLGVGTYHGLACRTRRGVYAYYLVHGHCIESEGVLVTQVILGGEGQFGDVIKALDVLRLDAHLVEFLPVEGYLLIAGLHGLLQSLKLEFLHRLAVHALHSWIVYHICSGKLDSFIIAQPIANYSLFIVNNQRFTAQPLLIIKFFVNLHSLHRTP